MPAVQITEVDEHIPVPVDQTTLKNKAAAVVASQNVKKPSDDTIVVSGPGSATSDQTREWISNNPITLKKVQEICVKHGFYKTPSCNDKLYLHHKGWDKIADLEQYTECRVLWLEGNCLGKIEGLDSMRTSLRSLYLHENMLTNLDGVNSFENLDSLNVSDNHISTLNGLLVGAAAATSAAATTATGGGGGEAAGGAVSSAETFKTEVFAEERQSQEEEAASTAAANAASAATGGKLFQTLNTLQIKNNNLKHIEDLQVLVNFESLSVLDLTGNKIEDGEGILNILEKMPNLKSLKLSGNPCVRKMTMYRRLVLSRCTKLMHLDDRPVFEDERRTVTAWTIDGAEGEKAERLKIKQEAEDKVTKRLSDFKQMCLDAGATKSQVDGGVGVSGDGEDDDSEATSSSSSDDEREEEVVEAAAAGPVATEEVASAASEAVTTESAAAAASPAESNSATASRKHIDPEVEVSSAAPPVLIEREVAAPAATAGPSSTAAASPSSSSSSPQKLQPGANSKYAKIWEMATQVSEAKEQQQQQQEQDGTGSGQQQEDFNADEDDDGDAWTPE